VILRRLKHLVHVGEPREHVAIVAPKARKENARRQVRRRASEMQCSDDELHHRATGHSRLHALTTIKVSGGSRRKDEPSEPYSASRRQPMLPDAHTKPLAIRAAATMKSAVSNRVSVQSLRMVRLNCWTVSEQDVFDQLTNS
jgi:hypothetical protein